MKSTYPVPPHGKETWKWLTEIHRFGYSYSDIFSDFIEAVLAALLSLTDNLQRHDYETFREKVSQNALDGQYVDRYMGLVEKYKENKTRNQGERPADFFANAWGCLQVETRQSQEDVLGDLYECQVSFGEHGQFFTPASVIRAITEMLGSHDGETVYEPAVGSGRMLIVAAQTNPNRHFVGIDVSPICARMAALNMWLFNLNADIYQGNTLSMEMSYLWRIRKGGYIWQSKIDGTIAPPAKTTPPKKGASTQERPIQKKESIKKNPPTQTVQQTLFD